MKVEKRLLKYIAIKTPCDENSDTVPTSQCQFDLARILADELKELGLDKVVLDDKCFVYGILAATPGYENKKKKRFRHLDLSHIWILYQNFARQKSIRSVHQIMTDVISFSETVDGFLQPKISRI